jgi:protein-S-isoprenylcysteine O-methyltransferase Ste14
MKVICLQNKKFSDILISVKPNTFMSFAFIVIVLTGILGWIFSWPILIHGLGGLIIGLIIFILGWVLHLYCHKFHKKAHKVADQIQNVITSGPFSSIRHPMYLGLILMYFGLAIGWGIV